MNRERRSGNRDVLSAEWPRWLLAFLVSFAAPSFVPDRGFAFGNATAFDIRELVIADSESSRPGATQRMAWEVRQRTSIETRLLPTRVRLSDESLFDAPFLYWPGSESFEPLGDEEVAALRRFVDLGGFVFVDDVDPEDGGFDTAFRRAVGRAFPDKRLEPVSASSTVFRSFYLLEQPQGRLVEAPPMEGLFHDERLAVLYARNDVAGALSRQPDGQWTFLLPGGERQREMATRFVVNVVMYALCLDYKDDQVHAPFIMRRRGRREP